MRFLIFIALLGFATFACSGITPKEQESTEKKAKAKKPVDGEKVYKQYCVICHGVSGDMGASGAFNLKESKLSVAEKITIISDGRNTMTPFKGLLSNAKIKAVAEYTEKLKN